MKQTTKCKKGGWLFFFIAIGFFCVQMGFFFLQSRYEVEYVDNRLFYLMNISIVIFMVLSIIFLLTLTKMWKMVIASITVVLILNQVSLLINHNSRTKHIVSLSTDLRHVLVIKENRETGQATYFASVLHSLKDFF